MTFVAPDITSASTPETLPNSVSYINHDNFIDSYENHIYGSPIQSAQQKRHSTPSDNDENSDEDLNESTSKRTRVISCIFILYKKIIFVPYFLVRLNPVELNLVGRSLVGRNLVGLNLVGLNLVELNLVELNFGRA